MKKSFYIISIFIFWFLFLAFNLVYFPNKTEKFYNKNTRIIGNYYLHEKNIWGWFGWPWNNYLAICTKSDKCSEWQVKWIKLSDRELYIYFSPVMYEIEDMLTIFKDNSYSIFNDGIYYTLDSDLNNAKTFWIFTQESMNFYSINDLEKLQDEQKNILLELKEKPRFIYE